MYKRRHLPRALAELDYFRNLPNLDICINNAALAINHKGLRYKHQCRISKKTLSIARDILLANKKSIRIIRNFDELFELVGNL